MFFVFVLLTAPCRMWDLGSLTRDQTCSPWIRSAVLTTGLPGRSPKKPVITIPRPQHSSTPAHRPRGGGTQLERAGNLPTHSWSTFSLTPRGKRRHSQTLRQKEDGEGLRGGEEGPPHSEAFVGFPSVEVETLHLSSVFVPPWGRWKQEGGRRGWRPGIA